MKIPEVHKNTTAQNQIQEKREPFFTQKEQGDFFSKSNGGAISFFNPITTIQPKLKIGQPNDKYEVEADAMADKVVQRLNDPSVSTGYSRTGNVSLVQSKCATCEQEEKLQKKEEEEIPKNDLEIQTKPIFESTTDHPETDIQAKAVTPFIQTKCASCEQEEKLQKKEEEVLTEEPMEQTKLNIENDGDEDGEVQPQLMLKKTEEKPPEEEEPVQLKQEEEQLQKKENRDEVASSDLQSQLNSSKGGGSALPDDTKSSMESGFNADFSNVRIHTGTQANEMNSELGARAFTHGSDIYFNEGEYNPNTSSGQHLLAHELTHTVQQGAVVRQKPKQSYHQTQPKIQGLFGRIWSAAKSVGKAAWSGVKKVGGAVVKAVSKGVDWILGKISPILKRIPGYTLLTVILGKDIITGDQVDRNGPNLIKGFIGLVPGGHDLWMKLEESKMITDAFGWLNGEITKLGLSWGAIKGAFKTAVSSISVTDVFSPLEAFNTKIKPIFAPILAKILTLSKKVVKKVAEFILEGFLRLAGPFGKKVMDILRKAGDTFWTIVGDPIAFLNNLIKAVKGGVNKFKTNIKKHLIGGLIGWLTGAMGDLPIQIPQTFDVKGVLHLGLQIMGVTWDNIRQKLVKRIGEPLVKAAETSVTIVKTLITQGPMGLWEMLKEKAVEIKQTIMGGIRNWVITQLVKQGIVKILSFLNPAGALVQAALAIYNGVMFFVENWQRISDFVNSIFSSIGKIAAGNLTAAMTFIEKAMAQSIPVILSFIARLLNIGAIGKAIKKIIQKIRKPIDKVIRKVIDFIAKQVRRLFRAGKKGFNKVKGALLRWWKTKKSFRGNDGKQHKLFFKGSDKSAILMVASTPENYFDFIRRIKIPKDNKAALNTKINAKAKAAEVDKEAKRPLKGANEKEKEKDSKLKKTRVNTLLSELAPLTAILMGIQEGELPKSVIVYNGQNSRGFAKRVEGRILSREGDPGSVPQEMNTAYETLFMRKLGNGIYYVRGHMINEHLHGPGKLKNLTPLSVRGNKNHLKAAEDPVKIAVRAGTVVRYTVSARYDRPTISSDISDQEFEKAGIPLEERENVKKIRSVENDVPSGLTLGADVLKKNNAGKWVKDKTIVSGRSILNPIDTNLSSYKTTKGPIKKAVGIKSSSIEELKAKTGIAEDIISTIKKAAMSIPGTIFNIGQIKNKLPETGGYLEEKKILYRIALDKISGMDRSEIKFN